MVADEWQGFSLIRIPDVQKGRATFERLDTAFEAEGLRRAPCAGFAGARRREFEQ